MARPLVAVVLASYERAHLLRRSLECYENQDFDNSTMELVVVDDHSTDDTQAVVRDWGRRTGIRYQIVVPGPKTEAWRDCGSVINSGIRATTAKHLILSHPEVMPAPTSVRRCVEALEANPGAYFGSKVYYLGVRDQELIDTVPWQTEGALAVRRIAGFYAEDGNGHPDYKHAVTDMVGTPGFRIPTWESWVWSGVTRDTMRTLGGFVPTQRWGAVDVLFLHRRRWLGIPTITPGDPDCAVVHQNHSLPGDVPTPRVEEVWKQELDTLLAGKSADDLRFPAVDELGW